MEPIIEKPELQRKHRAVECLRKEGFYEQLLEHINEAVWAGDSDEKTVYVNPAFLRLSGYTLEECLQRTCFDFFEDEDKDVIIRESAKRPAGIASQYQISIKNKSGEKIPVLVSGSPIIQDGKWVGSIGIMADLREVRKREAYDKHLAAVLEHTVDAIVSLDANGKVVSWNHGAQVLFKYTPEEIIGKSITCIIPQSEEDEINRMRAEVSLRGFIRNYQATRLAKDATPIPVSISESAIKNNGGKIIGYSVLYRDISAQKKWEQELQTRFDKMQAAYLEMGRQRRYLDYLTEILEIALGKTTYGDIANYIVNAFIMISQADAVTFRLYNEKKDRLELIAIAGIGKDWWGKKYIDVKGTIFEKAFKAKKTLKILDVWSEPSYPSQALARKYNLKSLLLIPLTFKDIKLGSISLYISQNNSLSVLDNEFIGIFAKAIAVILALRKGKIEK